MTKTHAEYQAIGRARRRANGKCRQCESPAGVRPDGTLYSTCDKHREADNERTAERRARKAKPSE